MLPYFSFRKSAIVTSCALCTLATLPLAALAQDATTSSPSGDNPYRLARPSSDAPPTPLTGEASDTSLQGGTNSTSLTGGVSAYAIAPSSAPLMQGKACNSLPRQWQGVWHGTLGHNEPDLVGQTSTADARNPHLTGQGAKVALNLAAVKEGSEIEELSVTDERRQQSGADPTPDIIFFHDGGNGHLLVLPGARIHTHTQHGDVYIGGNGVELIGDNVVIGSPNSSSPAAQNPMNRQINYNNGGIQINGPTTFNDRYFKADERIKVADGTQITAGRVDISSAKMYPHGQTIDVIGSSTSGYTVTRLPALIPDTSDSSAQTIASPPYDMLKDAHPANSTTVMVAPGIYDQCTLSPIQAPDGSIAGYREMLARYTALGPDKMLVQISVGNPGQSASPDFSISGYLRKKLP